MSMQLCCPQAARLCLPQCTPWPACFVCAWLNAPGRSQAHTRQAGQGSKGGTPYRSFTGSRATVHLHCPSQPACARCNAEGSSRRTYGCQSARAQSPLALLCHLLLRCWALSAQRRDAAGDAGHVGALPGYSNGTEPDLTVRGTSKQVQPCGKALRGLA